jgi:hypothetical protein
MTNEGLTKERNFFLIGFFILVAINLLLRLLTLAAPPQTMEKIVSIGMILTVFAKGFFVYLVFRLSRFLRHPVWLTVIYCIVTPFSLLYLIPFVGVLIGIKNVRKALASDTPSIPT